MAHNPPAAGGGAWSRFSLAHTWVLDSQPQDFEKIKVHCLYPLVRATRLRLLQEIQVRLRVPRAAPCFPKSSVAP